jgi:hypothetical protein
LQLGPPLYKIAPHSPYHSQSQIIPHKVPLRQDALQGSFQVRPPSLCEETTALLSGHCCSPRDSLLSEIYQSPNPQATFSASCT